MGNSTYGDKDHIKMVDTESADGAQLSGSIMGEGSFVMIVAFLALITSGVSIFLVADMKKKLASVKVSNDTEAEDEE